jgi:hypothetical protein
VWGGGTGPGPGKAANDSGTTLTSMRVNANGLGWPMSARILPYVVEVSPLAKSIMSTASCANCWLWSRGT